MKTNYDTIHKSNKTYKGQLFSVKYEPPAYLNWLLRQLLTKVKPNIEKQNLCNSKFYQNKTQFNAQQQALYSKQTHFEMDLKWETVQWGTRRHSRFYRSSPSSFYNALTMMTERVNVYWKSHCDFCFEKFALPQDLISKALAIDKLQTTVFDFGLKHPSSSKND